MVPIPKLSMNPSHACHIDGGNQPKSTEHIPAAKNTLTSINVMRLIISIFLKTTLESQKPLSPAMIRESRRSCPIALKEIPSPHSAKSSDTPLNSSESSLSTRLKIVTKISESENISAVDEIKLLLFFFSLLFFSLQRLHTNYLSEFGCILPGNPQLISGIHCE